MRRVHMYASYCCRTSRQGTLRVQSRAHAHALDRVHARPNVRIVLLAHPRSIVSRSTCNYSYFYVLCTSLVLGIEPKTNTFKK